MSTGRANAVPETAGGEERQRSASPKVDIRTVTKTFQSSDRRVEALSETSLRVAEGEFLSIVGPSGCGKTTLLRMIAGLEHPTSGSIRLRRDAPQRPLVSVVFQEASIFPWLTTRKNAEYGLAVRGVPVAERRRRVELLLDRVGLLPFADAYPRELSGGMKQRTSLVRAFANDPELMLMDEPFAAVDEQTRLSLQEQLLEIWEETHKTVVFVTHSIQEALLLSDRIAVMGIDPGHIKALIDVEFSRPRRVYELKTDQTFARMEREIWEMLQK